MRQYEASAKTKEEAIELGLQELGVSIGDVDVLVVEEGSKGLFGLFGSRPVKVRLTVKDSEEDPLGDLLEEKPARKAEKKPERKPEKKPAEKGVSQADTEALAGIPALAAAIFALDEPAEIADVPEEEHSHAKKDAAEKDPRTRDVIHDIIKNVRDQ